MSSTSSRHVSTSLIATLTDAPCRATRVLQNGPRHRPRQPSLICLPHPCLLPQAVHHHPSLFISAAPSSKQPWSRATSRRSSSSQSMSTSWNGLQSMVRPFSSFGPCRSNDGVVFDFYTNLNEFYGVISECCTQHSCPTMSAGPK